jgi:O-methyltransferase
MISEMSDYIASVRDLVGGARAMDYRQIHRLRKIYQKYKNYTMIPESFYIDNLSIAEANLRVRGCVVECGVWRGGMIAGIADVMGSDREYFLFDSFEGLPPARDIDGPAALAWQLNTESPGYYDNCRASVEEASAVMRMSAATSYSLIKGWFDDTVPAFRPPQEIAMLRLDGDWHDSVLTCLRNLYPFVSPDGVVVVDDYYAWDGCARAVHEFLFEQQENLRIRQIWNRVCVLVKGRREIY